MKIKMAIDRLSTLFSNRGKTNWSNSEITLPVLSKDFDRQNLLPIDFDRQNLLIFYIRQKCKSWAWPPDLANDRELGALTVFVHKHSVCSGPGRSTLKKNWAGAIKPQQFYLGVPPRTETLAHMLKENCNRMLSQQSL